MTRARLSFFAGLPAFLIACQITASEPDQPSAIDQPPEHQIWVAVPVEAGEDLSTPNDSIKWPMDSGIAATSPDDSNDGTYTFTDPGVVSNDLNDDAGATTCAARETDRGSYLDVSDDAGAPSANAVSISRDWTEQNWGSEGYRTTFVLEFRSPGLISTDPAGGRSRTDLRSQTWVTFRSPTSRPDAFAIGVPEPVTIDVGPSDQVTCYENGDVTYTESVYAEDEEVGIATITLRSATRVQGILEYPNHRVTFDAPWAIDAPLDGDYGICCLR
jgi:hypothetical protein